MFIMQDVFRKQILTELNFSDADIAGCDFTNAVFEGGSLRGAHVKQAKFDKADLRATDIGRLQQTSRRTHPGIGFSCSLKL